MVLLLNPPSFVLLSNDGEGLKRPEISVTACSPNVYPEGVETTHKAGASLYAINHTSFPPVHKATSFESFPPNSNRPIMPIVYSKITHVKSLTGAFHVP